MPEFKGTVTELPRIHRCPVCGANPVLRKNSTKRFQIWCKCGCKTGWDTKPEVIIDWYNLILAVEMRKEEQERKQKEGL